MTELTEPLFEAFEHAFRDSLEGHGRFRTPSLRRIVYAEALEEDPSIRTSRSTIDVFQAERVLKDLLADPPHELEQDKAQRGTSRVEDPPETVYSALRRKFIDGVRRGGFEAPTRLTLSSEAQSPFIKEVKERWVLRLPTEPFTEHGFEFFADRAGILIAVGPPGLVIPPERIEARAPAKHGARAWRNLDGEVSP